MPNQHTKKAAHLNEQNARMKMLEEENESYKLRNKDLVIERDQSRLDLKKWTEHYEAVSREDKRKYEALKEKNRHLESEIARIQSLEAKGRQKVDVLLSEDIRKQMEMIFKKKVRCWSREFFSPKMIRNTREDILSSYGISKALIDKQEQKWLIPSKRSRGDKDLQVLQSPGRDSKSLLNFFVALRYITWDVEKLLENRRATIQRLIDAALSALLKIHLFEDPFRHYSFKDGLRGTHNRILKNNVKNGNIWRAWTVQSLEPTPLNPSVTSSRKEHTERLLNGIDNIFTPLLEPESIVLKNADRRQRLEDIIESAAKFASLLHKQNFEFDIIDKSYLDSDPSREARTFETIKVISGEDNKIESMTGEDNDGSNSGRRRSIDGIIELGFVRRGDEHGDYIDDKGHEEVIMKASVLLADVNIEYCDLTLD